MQYNGDELNEPVQILNAFADSFRNSFAPSSDCLGDVNNEPNFNNINNPLIHVSEFKEDDEVKALKK